SSPGTLGSGMSVMPVSPRCGVAPKVVASRTPSHGSGGTGAAKRRSPTGAAAKGIPRNATDPSRRTPRTSPASIRTTGEASSSGIRSVFAEEGEERLVDLVAVRPQQPVRRALELDVGRVRHEL